MSCTEYGDDFTRRVPEGGHPVPNYSGHFGVFAVRYDELRPEDLSDGVIEVLVREGKLRGHHVLNSGGGTGRVAAVLAERYATTVCGVDPSPRCLKLPAAGRLET